MDIKELKAKKPHLVVAVTSDVLGDENNGGTIAAMNLIRSLRQKGHTVRIISADQDKKGVPGYYILPTNWLNRGVFKNYLNENKVVLAKADEAIFRKAYQGVDVVHFMTPLVASRGGAKVATEMGLPTSFGFHTQPEYILAHLFLLHSHFISDRVYHYWWRSMISKMDIIHYPTQWIRDYFEKRILHHPTKGEVISNGVKPIFYPLKVEREPRFAHRFVILSIGRYSREKGHETLYKAVLLSRHREEIQLVFAGQGPQEKAMRRWGKKLPHEPILGFYNHDDLVSIIRQADLYCHPSYAEIEAISCLEAMTCGLVPVIADSIETATKYFAHDERNLFKCGDAHSLAEKIDYWIEHPEEKLAASRDSIEIASKNAFSKCMDEMEDLLYKAIQIHESKKK